MAPLPAGAARDNPRLIDVSLIIEKPAVALARAKLHVNGLPAETWLGWFGMHLLAPSIYDILGEMIRDQVRDNGEFQFTRAQEIQRQRDGYLALEMTDAQRFDTSEEMRVQNILVEIAAKRQKKVFEWTYSSGIVPAGASIQSQKSRNPATKDPLAALDMVIEQVEPAIFLFKDFHPFLTRNNFAVIRRLKDIALHLKNSCKTIVLISPVMEIPAELDKEVTVINFPQPTKEDLAALLDKIIEDLRGSKQVQIETGRGGPRAAASGRARA